MTDTRTDALPWRSASQVPYSTAGYGGGTMLLGNNGECIGYVIVLNKSADCDPQVLDTTVHEAIAAWNTRPSTPPSDDAQGWADAEHFMRDWIAAEEAPVTDDVLVMQVGKAVHEDLCKQDVVGYLDAKIDAAVVAVAVIPTAQAPLLAQLAERDATIAKLQALYREALGCQS